jgi:Ca2+-binding RTX toxin-like protein
MTTLSEQTRNDRAKKVIDLTTSLRDGMWKSAEALTKVKLPIPAQIASELFNHTMKNVVTNEFDANPTKYVVNAVASFSGAEVGAFVASLAGGAAVTVGAGFVLGGVAAGLLFEYAYATNFAGTRDYVNGFNNWAGSVADYAARMPDEFSQYMDDVVKEMSEALSDFAEKMQNDVEQTFEDISQYLSEAYESIINDLAQAYDFVAAQLSSLLNNVGNFLSEVWEGIKDWFEDLFGDDAPQEAKPQTPIVLDMDGDGIELINLSASRVYFDIDNDGFKEKTAWVAPDDALLAFDRNGNGVIDNQTELFGRRPSDGTLANRDGFDILETEFDSNRDRLITSADANFNQLRVWNDLNGDGISQANELRSLAQAGITRINLNESNSPSEIFLGRRAVEKSDFTINGVVRSAFDLLFDVNQTASEYILPANYQYAAGVTSLPSLSGIGDVKPLWVAMTDDTTLRSMVQNFNNQNYSNVNFGQLRTTVENILYQWTGTTNVANSGKHLSARIVETMDRWFGLDTNNGDFNQNKGRLYLREWEDIINDTMTKLLLQQSSRPTALQGLSYDKSTGLILGDLGAAVELIEAAQPASGAARHAYWQDYLKIINAVADVQGYSDDFYRSMLEGTYLDSLPDDVVTLRTHRILERAVGQDNIIGSDRGEYIWSDNKLGLTTSVTVEGGGGDDRIEILPLFDRTSAGNNTDYIYNRGDGNDTINDHIGNNDRLFLKGINSNEVQFRLTEYDLLRDDTLNQMNDVEINIGNEATILLENYNLLVSESRNVIEQIVFDDRTVQAAEVMSLARQNTYSNGSDWIYDRNNSLINDATEQTQIFDGSTGSDFFYFTTGAPIRLNYDLGDGFDRIYPSLSNVWDTPITINFGANISLNNLQFTTEYLSGLVIHINDNDALYLVDYLTSKRSVTLQFGSGPVTSINLRDALVSRNALFHVDNNNYTPYNNAGTGTGNQTINGTSGADTLQGGAGNDLLVGGAGNDTYQYNANGGFDRINEFVGNGTDTLRFGSGLTFDKLRIIRQTDNNGNGSALLMTFDGYTGGVFIPNQIGLNTSAIDNFVFDNGATTLTVAQIYAKYFADNSTSGDNVVRTFRATVNGNVTIDGGAGNDLIRGEGISELLLGGSGNDTIVSFDTQGRSTMRGGDGNDYIILPTTGRGASIEGGNGNDVLIGGSDFSDGDTIHGNAGHDYIRGASKNDILHGNEGNDTIYALGGNDSVIAGAGNDFIYGMEGNDTLVSGAGMDYVIGGSGADRFIISRAANANTIIRDFAPLVPDERIDLSAFGTSQALTYNIVRSDIHINLPDNQLLVLERVSWKELSAANFVGVASITPHAQHIVATAPVSNVINGTSAADSPLNGTANNDVINGLSGNDDIFGFAGNDTIAGGLGVDYIATGAGNDVILYNNISESNAANGIDYIGDFVQGQDKINVSALGFTSVSNFSVFSNATYSEISSSNGFVIGFNGSFAFTNADFIFAAAPTSNVINGTSGSDSPLNGTANNDVINGLAGNDDIFGFAGNETIAGGLGVDYIATGAGNDVIIYNSISESNAANGIDYIGDFVQGQDKINVSALGFTNVSNFSVFSNATYSEISANGFVLGFNGNYSFTNADFIFAAAPTSNVINGTSAADSPLNGTANNDVINGLAGNDDIFGNGGNDTIAGGLGVDYIATGAGNDVILYNSISESNAANGIDYIGDFVQGQDKINVSALGFTNVSNFSVFSNATYSEISSSNGFVLGFNGSFAFTNADFIFV